MAENEPNVNYKKIEFYVLESDLGKITYLDFVISKYLKNGKDIPHQIMDEYVKCIKTTLDKPTKYYPKEKLDKIKLEVKNRILTKYQIQPRSKKYSIEALVDYIFNCLGQVDTRLNKIDLIEKIESIISDSYDWPISPISNGVLNKNISHYQECVLIGAIVHKFGFHISKDLSEYPSDYEPTNRQLFLGVRNIYKKKKRLKKK